MNPLCHKGKIFLKIQIEYYDYCEMNYILMNNTWKNKKTSKSKNIIRKNLRMEYPKM